MMTSLSAKPPRNILLIVADDLNTSLGCYGAPVKTPNIDQLARQGARFDHAYCTYPLCGPSRNSFLTGLYPDQTGIVVNRQLFRQTIPDRPSLPQYFRQQGYLAVRIGKMFHYEVPYSIGTTGHDDPASWEIDMNPIGADRLEDQAAIHSLVPGDFAGMVSWYASSRPDAEHTDAKIADDAIWVLQRCAQRRERPFFLAVGFFRPHTPYVAPAHPYFDWYPEEKIALPPKTDDSDVPQAALASRRPEFAQMTDALRREARQGYFASISFMDAQVGRVLEALRATGLGNDTIVIFTSDHGYHLGEHGLWQKLSLFEESTRVPLIVHTPDRAPSNKTVTTPVSLIDLFPTLCTLAQIRPPGGLAGQDLSRMLNDAADKGRGWALSEVGRGAGAERFYGYSLRTPDWRYTEWKDGQAGTELYDHRVDPQELHNLATDPSYAQTRATLAAQLKTAIGQARAPDGKRPVVHQGMWTPVLMPR